MIEKCCEKNPSNILYLWLTIIVGASYFLGPLIFSLHILEGANLPKWALFIFGGGISGLILLALKFHNLLDKKGKSTLAKNNEIRENAQTKKSIPENITNPLLLFFWGIFLFLAGGFIGASKDGFDGDAILAFMVFLGILTLAFSLGALPSKKRNIIGYLIFSSVIIVVIVAYLQVLGLIPSNKHRPFSTLGNPAWLSSYLATMAPFILHFFRGKKINPLYAIIIFAIVFLTRSISGILALMAGMTIYNWDIFKKYSKNFTKIGLFTIIFGTILVIPSFLNYHTTNYRLYLHKISSVIIKENFPWGSGFGSYRRQAMEAQEKFLDKAENRLWLKRRTQISHSHNDLLEILSEGGLFGIAGYLLMIITPFFTPSRIAKATATAFFVDGLFDFPLYQPATLLAFFSTVLLGFVLEREKLSKEFETGVHKTEFLNDNIQSKLYLSGGLYKFFGFLSKGIRPFFHHKKSPIKISIMLFFSLVLIFIFFFFSFAGPLLLWARYQVNKATILLNNNQFAELHNTVDNALKYWPLDKNLYLIKAKACLIDEISDNNQILALKYARLSYDMGYSPDSLEVQGLSLANLKKEKEAIFMLEKALKHHHRADIRKSRWVLSGLYKKLGLQVEYEKSLLFWLKFVNGNFVHPLLNTQYFIAFYFELARICEENGNFEGAIDYLEQGLAILPNLKKNQQYMLYLENIRAKALKN